MLAEKILARARPDLIESAIVLAYRSPKRPPRPVSWAQLKADPDKMEKHLGTRDGSVAWLLFTLQHFGSMSLNLQYAAIYSLEPMVLTGMSAMFAQAIKSYFSTVVSAGFLIFLIVGVPYLWTWSQ